MNTTTRIVGTIASCAVILSACSTEPAHADALPPGFKPKHVEFPTTARPSPSPTPNERQIFSKLGVPPSVPPGRAGANRVYDTPIGGVKRGYLAGWYGSPVGWVAPVTAMSRWRGSDGPAAGPGSPPGLPPGWNPPGPPGPPKPPHNDPPHHDPHDDPAVPGPLGASVLAGAFHFSRKLRSRINNA